MPNDGARFEREVTAFLKGQGLPAVERPRQTRWYDVGDVWVDKDVVLQTKAYANITTGIRDGVAGAADQAVRSNRPFGIAVVKRAGKSVNQAYAVMPLEVLADLLKSRPRPDSTGLE